MRRGSLEEQARQRNVRATISSCEPLAAVWYLVPHEGHCKVDIGLSLGPSAAETRASPTAGARSRRHGQVLALDDPGALGSLGMRGRMPNWLRCSS